MRELKHYTPSPPDIVSQKTRVPLGFLLALAPIIIGFGTWFTALYSDVQTLKSDMVSAKADLHDIREYLMPRRSFALKTYVDNSDKDCK